MHYLPSVSGTLCLTVGGALSLRVRGLLRVLRCFFSLCFTFKLGSDAKRGEQRGQRQPDEAVRGNKIRGGHVATVGGRTCSAQRRPLRALRGRLERRRHQRGGRQAGVRAQFSEVTKQRRGVPTGSAGFRASQGEEIKRRETQGESRANPKNIAVKQIAALAKT